MEGERKIQADRRLEAHSYQTLYKFRQSIGRSRGRGEGGIEGEIFVHIHASIQI